MDKRYLPSAYCVTSCSQTSGTSKKWNTFGTSHFVFYNNREVGTKSIIEKGPLSASFIEGFPLFRVFIIGGSTVWCMYK